MSETEYALRKAAIHLLRSGKSPAEVAQELDRSLFWVYKWRERFFKEQNWQALYDQPHTPKRQPKKLSQDLRQAIRQARSELEAEAVEPGKLSYIDARAVSARLRKKKLSPLPSITSIERELRTAGMTRPYHAQEVVDVVYPHIHPTQPLQLVQIDDIVPHYLPGGPCVSCFNAIDVFSRYPAGQPSLTKRSEDAANFLIHAWRELGIPEYTQVDNESCFSGGFTHPGVLGKVLRLALRVGTQLIFSPFRHPESNDTVERFHQDYSKNIWDKIELPDFQAVQKYSPAFFDAYRHSEHHSALQGRCPADLHPAQALCQLPAEFCLPGQLPLTVGQVHFIRRVNQDSKVTILNIDWDIPLAKTNQGVWATLRFTVDGATLRIYDTAPDAKDRVCLVEYIFPLKEDVLGLAIEFQRPVEILDLPFLQLVADFTVCSLASPVSAVL